MKSTTVADSGVQTKPATGSDPTRGRSKESPGPLERALDKVSDLATLAARVSLGFVFAWFGVQELLQPAMWAGYIPLLSPKSGLAVGLIVAHGWLLLLLSVSLVLGVVPRLGAAVGAVLMAQIVITLGLQGVSALVVRDVGVMGLALALMARPHTRWTISA